MAYTGTTIKDLSTSTPAEGSSIVPELNDSDREIKTVLKNQYAITTLTALATLDATHSVVLCNGTFTVTLPSIATVSSATHIKEYTIINIGTGVITIGGTVNGVVNPTLSAQYSGRKIVGNGTVWTWLKEVTFDANGRINEVANTIWDGTAARSVSPTPAANTIPVSNGSGSLADGWFAGLLSGTLSGITRMKRFTIRPKTATITIASPGVVSITAHGYEINDSIVFSTTGALPTGIVAGTTYYIISAGFTVDAFQVAATVGGTAINTTGAQSGTHTVKSVWVTDSSINGAVVVAVGGGGGGGSGDNGGTSNSVGGGGGGAGEGRWQLTVPTASTAYLITIGTGGTGGAGGGNPSSSNNGTAGTQTIVENIVTVQGGNYGLGGVRPTGGIGGAAPTFSNGGTGTNPGSAGSGAFIGAGGNGGNSGATAVGGGGGGSSAFGIGGNGGNGSFTQVEHGSSGVYGSGGGGGNAGSNGWYSGNGGNGGDGIVVIWWW